ncbi:MAG: acyl-ACP--UDP-N-acetylglucosamine O-acyltransferase [Armatimonadetes bacterium]|nr:acyl-ACP--UDP-N-acetylglucosamine O-acyltransferase [Armatimonadota bacterium]MDE2207739.1 acyl-ACP--UDP-N-acetylglucosamine O-acyltransferase [Armatimonadota bacterium]
MAIAPELTASIHPTAIIDRSAELDAGVEIGPYCIIGPHVFLGAGTVLHAHVVIQGYTRIGSNCQIHSGAIIGGPPQDTKFKNERSYVSIGDNNILRECVTIHRATGEGNRTVLRDNIMLMAYAHVAHNCDIGNYVTIASYAGISGHVTVEDNANIGGIVGVHQFCRIGRLAMVGGMSGVTQDVPPYMLAAGRPAKVYDVNTRGLRRYGISQQVRIQLREAYKLLYRSDLNVTQAMEAIGEEIPISQELDHLLEFIRSIRNGVSGRGNNLMS